MYRCLYICVCDYLHFIYIVQYVLDTLHGFPSHLFFQDFRKKAAKLVASKCALAARVDSFHQSVNGEMGEGKTCIYMYCKILCTFDQFFLSLFSLELKIEIQKKIDKLLEPPPIKRIKPLPRPDDLPKKRRGGKRFLCLSSF